MLVGPALERMVDRMPYILTLAAGVAIANILLNTFTSKAAAESEAWLKTFGTLSFGLAFIIGTISLLLMTTLYHVGRQSAFGMANGILLMGALSIIGGTLVGYFFRGSTVHWSEWTLLVLIACFITVRYCLTTGVVGR
jgi:hypothetical protein